MKKIISGLAILCMGLSSQGQDTKLYGEVGEAQQLSEQRMFREPFMSTAWIRADLTNERASAYDSVGNSVLRRPFKAFSGDISGRYLELMSLLSHGNREYHPVLRGFLREVPTLQKPDGTFGWAAIDWNGAVDFNDKGHTPLMMPALWGNGRMLCGLVQAYETFGDTALLSSAQKLGDFYVRTQDRFMDTTRIAEYKKGGTYASGFVTCYFNAFEGLVRLYGLKHEKRFLAVSERMAEFLAVFDHLPLEHAHGMLCNQYALLLLYEETHKPAYLQRVEKRWQEMVDGGYSDPAGGVLEGATIGYKRDEGCAETDWLRVNLRLAALTGKSRYFDRAERLLRNHYLANQCSTGGFGHRFIMSDKEGVTGIGVYSQEATWCCDFHGAQGFELLRPFVAEAAGRAVRVNFALEFETGTLRSDCDPFHSADSLFVQKLTAKKDLLLRIRKPEWARGVRAAVNGVAVVMKADGAYLAPVRGIKKGETLTVYYKAPVYRESRTGKAPVTAGAKFVVRHGPFVLMSEGEDMGRLQPRVMRQDSLRTVMVFDANVRK